MKTPRKAKLPMKARGPQRMTDKQLKAGGFKIGLWRFDERKNRLEFAKAGYRWFSVFTPTVFREFHLPVDDNQRDAEQARQWDHLVNLARSYDTYVRASVYRVG